MSNADCTDRIREWMTTDPVRWKLLARVRDLQLPDCWIAAGFVRDAVWARLHSRDPVIENDVDVVWFDDLDSSELRDTALESRLSEQETSVRWSVKNQARMHRRNGDRPYRSSEDAMRFWPETATAIAVRRTENDLCEVIAPFGLDDLLSLKLRPAGSFVVHKRSIFDARVSSKQWLDRFPLLRAVD